MQNTDRPLKSFFLFINSGSGGNLGKQMLSDEVEKYEFRMPIHSETDYQRVDVYFYNLRDKASKQRGFKRMKLVQQHCPCVAVVCGGDGSVMYEYKDVLGTGNDFSRALGWGGSPFLKWSLRELKQLVRYWLKATEQDFDLWDVHIETYENGRFQKIQNQKDTVLQQKVIKKTFCNYFSFGIDGQIGYSFDKMRTTNKFANFAVYGAVGALNQLKKPIGIIDLVKYLHETPTPFAQKPTGKLILQSDSKHKKLYIYGQNGIQNDLNQNQKNILALNIDSYTGGTTGIWKNAKTLTSQQKNNQVSYSDQVIEVVSFDSGVGIAMEKSIGGFAKKVVQSSGPLRFDFKKVDDENHCTYAQIDGQFIRVCHPKSVVIQKSTFVPGGKIKVLKRDQKKSVFNPFKQIQQIFN